MSEWRDGRTDAVNSHARMSKGSGAAPGGNSFWIEREKTIARSAHRAGDDLNSVGVASFLQAGARTASAVDRLITSRNTGTGCPRSFREFTLGQFHALRKGLACPDF